MNVKVLNKKINNDLQINMVLGLRKFIVEWGKTNYNINSADSFNEGIYKMLWNHGRGDDDFD